jgi:poly(A) polymerase
MGTDRAHSDINSQKALLLGLALPQQIIAALAKHDAEVRFCGGVVRDIMIGQLKWPEPDIDMASPMPPKMAANILKAAGLKVIPTGIAHGTITVMLPSDPACKVELTTLRSDHNTDGRHAEVRFIEDWHADASRRDFTCNSLYMTASGAVIDPFGGLDDLAAGIVRFIGNPNDRIAEDVLRIFRFFRFYARFGQADIEPATATALINAASDIQSLSGERIAAELIKTFSYRSLKTITMMDNLGIWRALTGDQIYIDDYAALLNLDIEHNAMMALAVLTPPAVCDSLARRLKLSRNATQSLARMRAPLSAEQMAILLSAEYAQECWRCCHRQGWPLSDIAGAVIISAIRTNGHLPEDKANHLRQQIMLICQAEWPDMPVNGNDIRARGIIEGKQIGGYLTKLEDIWVADGFAPNRRTMLTMLDAMIAKD